MATLDRPGGCRLYYEVHGPAREGQLLAGGAEDLVGRDDDPAVGLEADLEPVALVGGDPGQEGEQNGNGRERATGHGGASAGVGVGGQSRTG